MLRILNALGRLFWVLLVISLGGLGITGCANSSDEERSEILDPQAARDVLNTALRIDLPADLNEGNVTRYRAEFTGSATYSGKLRAVRKMSQEVVNDVFEDSEYHVSDVRCDVAGIKWSSLGFKCGPGPGPTTVTLATRSASLSTEVLISVDTSGTSFFFLG